MLFTRKKLSSWFFFGGDPPRRKLHHIKSHQLVMIHYCITFCHLFTYTSFLLSTKQLEEEDEKFVT